MCKQNRFVEIEKIETDKGVIRICQDTMCVRIKSPYVIQYKAPEAVDYNTIHASWEFAYFTIDKAKSRLRTMLKVLQTSNMKINAR